MVAHLLFNFVIQAVIQAVVHDPISGRSHGQWGFVI